MAPHETNHIVGEVLRGLVQRVVGLAGTLGNTITFCSRPQIFFMFLSFSYHGDSDLYNLTDQSKTIAMVEEVCIFSGLTARLDITAV